MKKILFIHQNLQGGGAEKVLLDILNNFDYTTYDVTLLLFEGTGVYKDQVDSRVKIINLLSAREIATLGYLKKSNLWFIVNRFLRTKINKSLHDNTYDTIISFMEGVSIKCHSFIVNRAKRNISWKQQNHVRFRRGISLGKSIFTFLLFLKCSESDVSSVIVLLRKDME